MHIAEIFYSIQGEGRLAGTPSVFIRTSGCNLRCWFCDTDYTSWHPQGDDYSVEKVLAQVAEFPAHHAVVTGGEPLIAPQIEELCLCLRQLKYHVTVETAATIFKPLACDLASLSPKLSSSIPWKREGGRYATQHERLRLQFDVIRAFMRHSDFQLKFVIDRPSDVAEVQNLLDQLGPVDASKVLLMPQGVSREELHERALWLVEECKKYGYVYCPRLHIELYGNVRGT